MGNIINELHARAMNFEVCSKFTGNETPQELMQLMQTPQGVEFCTKNNFPDMDTLREFRGLQAESHGIYIDTNCELTNPTQLILSGTTHAVLHYDDPTKGHRVVLMHGATAEITATNWAVVFVKGVGAACTATDNAKIL